MAIRVRKLAKELERSPAEVLGLLHAIGFERYRSADDQIPDPMVQRLRSAIRAGIKPVPVVLSVPPPTPASSAPPAPAGEDLMARLVPGVRRADAPRPAPRPVTAVPVPAPPPVPHGAVAELAEQRARNLALLAEIDASRAALADERQAIDAARAAMTAEGDRLRAELAELHGRSRAPTLSALLEAMGHGTPGAQERVIAGLAAGQRLRTLLPLLRVDDPAALRALLAEPVPVTPPHPSVPADLDAEVPVGADRDLTRIGERLMLLGLRRLVVVGGNPRLHKLLRDAFDPRIDLRLRSGGPRPRPRSEAEADVTRSDAVFLWDVPLEPDAAQVYHTSRAVVVEAPDATVAGLIAHVNRRLDEI